MKLSGKTALVTGAAKRLGRATALALADVGARVVVHFHSSEDEAERLAAEIRQRGVESWTVRADLRDRVQTEALFGKVLSAAGPLDVLINNASVFGESNLATFTNEELHAQVDLNALAPLLLARRFAAQNRPGHIVNFLDCRIADYDKEHVAYHLSKRMLFSLTRMMAVEFAPAVQVNAVAPGLILPPRGKDEAYLERLVDTNPLHRYGGVEEVSAAVLFLLRSDFITGQVIYVDGGRHLRGQMYG